MIDIMRDTRIKLHLKGDNSWDITDDKGVALATHDDDYFIYMKNVNLKNGNLITGRYLGVLSPNSPMLDSQCKVVDIRDDGFYVNNTKTTSARMVAVNNKKNVIIIISAK